MSTTAGRTATATPTGPVLTSEQVWHELERASFAVLGYVTPDGEPRTSGVVFAVADRRLYVVTAPDSWKARHITTGASVAVTVTVRRGGLLTLMAPIPPATISFHATATVHPTGSLDVEHVSKRLASLLPTDRRDGCLIELAPTGTFLTYGIGVPLRVMARPAQSRAHVPVG